MCYCGLQSLSLLKKVYLIYHCPDVQFSFFCDKFLSESAPSKPWSRLHILVGWKYFFVHFWPNSAIHSSVLAYAKQRKWNRQKKKLEPHSTTTLPWKWISNADHLSPPSARHSHQFGTKQPFSSHHISSCSLIFLVIPLIADHSHSKMCLLYEVRTCSMTAAKSPAS